MNANVLFAVFKRNFTAYFSSPLGYAFILLFVAMSTACAIVPPDFFNTNLANLDQLNKWFLYIMLVFVPAITMAIWSDERRQGTDELVLTLPASDLDIVLGKYLAMVSIYTVSLLYSLAVNFAILFLLGSPDVGLILGTYFGYWLIGLAMLGIGMTASFLTGNLTVAFILGVVFNAPLVLMGYADTISAPVGPALRQWSYDEQFRDFGRGVITFSGIIYFAMIAALALYVCMILIGRRHWFTGAQRHALVAHYIARGVALVAILVGLNAVFHRHDLRGDVTQEKLSTLSEYTTNLLAKIDPKQPVQLAAFISPTVPDPYVQTRLTLLNTLREIESRSNGKVRVTVYDTERFTDNATLAQERYRIEPRKIGYLKRGAFAEDHVFLHVAASSGLQKVPPVFLDRGLPVEYELVRSIGTLAEPKRKKLGVLSTDAPLCGRPDFQSMSPGADWPVIEELKKQYDVVQVDPSKPIEEEFDVLLAVQPSSLGPEELNRFIDLVRSGTPTAIFEDPMPIFAGGVPATSAKRTPPGGMNPMMMMGMPNLPKGDIKQLWDLLGIEFPADQIVWQNFNPYRKASQFPKEFVFVEEEAQAGKFDARDPISAKLKQVLFPFAGWLREKSTSSLDFTPLVQTGRVTGTLNYNEMMVRTPQGQQLSPYRRFKPDSREFTLAAEISGKPKADKQPDGANPETPAMPEIPAKPKAKPPIDAKMHVVVVTDIDMLTEAFFRLREQGDNPEAGIFFNFDNVTFVLNVVDRLAGEDKFIELRSRRPAHRTLATIDKWTKQAREETDKSREDFIASFEKEEEKLRDEVQKKLANLKNSTDKQGALVDLIISGPELERRMKVQVEGAKRERDAAITRVETKLTNQIKSVQDTVKLWAMIVPTLPLCAIGLSVWIVRRSRESEGVSRSRMR